MEKMEREKRRKEKESTERRKCLGGECWRVLEDVERFRSSVPVLI